MEFIKDEEFLRGDCPMTKEEVRILSIAKLDISEEHRVLDIGAGTGSVTIQAAKMCVKGQVIGIEKDPAALEVIYKNIDKFKASNIKIVEGEALKVLNDIEGKFNRIFIGGSGGNIEDIIINYSRLLKEDGKMVLNFITIDNLYKSMNTLKSLGFKVECSQISVSKTKGRTSMLFANNPIFILEATR